MYTVQVQSFIFPRPREKFCPSSHGPTEIQTRYLPVEQVRPAQAELHPGLETCTFRCSQLTSHGRLIHQSRHGMYEVQCCQSHTENSPAGRSHNGPTLEKSCQGTSIASPGGGPSPYPCGIRKVPKEKKYIRGLHSQEKSDRNSEA